jgi:drug/metabolite transporter (DMT)-like permease
VQESAATPARFAASVRSGWIEAGFYVLAIAILTVIYAIATATGAHVVVFILYSMLISAAALLLLTGLGPDPVRVMLAPQSWWVGLSSITLESCYCLMLVTLPPADGNLLVRLSIPMALVMGFVGLGRRPDALTWVGAGVVLAGIAALVATFDLAKQAAGVVYGAAAAFFISCRGFASELHPWNRAARSIWEKMRVTGLVVLVTAVVSLALVAPATLLVAHGLLRRSALVPAPADLWHGPTILLAMLVGGAVFTAMSYLQFSSVVKIRTENFIATSAFMPVATLLVQHLAAAGGLLTLPPFDWRLLPAMVLVIAGVMVLIWANRRPA